MESLSGWLPIRIWQQVDEWRVDWCWFGERRLTQPFFRDAVDDALRLPFNQAFRRETALSVLSEWRLPAVAPTGFIYHASRCGSTLISQMLAQLDDHIVVSEPPPLDTLLRADLPPAERGTALRGLLAAYGQFRVTGERALVVKLDAWSIEQLPLLRDFFPDTPWLFVYRDPLEIAVSHMRRAGMHMVPGMLGHCAVNADIDTHSREEFIARRLARILVHGHEYCRDFAGLPVNYSELPAAMDGRLAAFFGLDGHARQRVFDSVGQHAKQPSQTFVADSHDKHREASDLLKQRVRFWAEKPFQALERLRLQDANANDDSALTAHRQ